MSKALAPLWISQELDTFFGVSSSKPWTATGVSINTQLLEEGDLFIALQGETGNGHDFLEDAEKKKAASAIVCEDRKTPLPTLKVSNTQSALETLAIQARNRSHALRMSVTGSVGKTTIKEMLKDVFGAQGKAHASVSSYNNFTGVPLSLARMPRDADYGIFEVGMNHPGEIRPLSKLIKPDIAIINKIVECHIEFFDSEEDIAKAKAEIFEGMEPGGRVILNHDCQHFTLLSELAQMHGLKVYSFGEHASADFRLEDWKGSFEGSTGTANIAGKAFPLTFKTPGHHWALNSLAVLGAAFLAGLDLQKAAQTVSELEPHTGRGTQYKGWFTLIDESYNANPTSMRAALAVLGKSEARRKIAVIGDMREMGPLSRKRHEELLEPLLENHIDLVFCCGPYMKHLFEILPESMKGAHEESSLELIPTLLKTISPEDCLSVKASLGTKMKPIVEALLTHQKKLEKREAS